jgi:hypothetical protein
MAMTSLQKEIVEYLLEGGSVSGNTKYGYRLKDNTGYPARKFSHRTFFILKPYLRLERGSFVLNKKYVRSLSKKYWIKQLYLSDLKKKVPPKAMNL